jgi:3-methyladenine DNA glycosylase AlkC
LTQEKFSLKDHLFNKDKVAKIANEIHVVYPEFLVENFIQDVVQAFPHLELKERITQIAMQLKVYIPFNYEKSVHILVSALPAPCNPYLKDDDFGDFIYASYSEYVALFGCEKHYLAQSYAALEDITQRFSAEYAIRPFFNHFPKETYNQMLLWASHSHYHVRRLASEGSRPNLPWGIKIKNHYSEMVAILDKLYCDTTRFVTRSVANHLNDISKLNAELVIQLLTQWKIIKNQPTNEMDFIVKHSLRTLVKKGHPKALELLGYSDQPKIELLSFDCSEKVFFNDFLKIKLHLKSLAHQSLMIDYQIHFVDANGKLTRKKVFKLKKTKVAEGEVFVATKKQHFLENTSTRKHYPGIHQIDILINGKCFESMNFELI